MTFYFWEAELLVVDKIFKKVLCEVNVEQKMKVAVSELITSFEKLYKTQEQTCTITK